MRFRLIVDGESRELEVQPTPQGLVVRVDGVPYRPRVRPVKVGFEVRSDSKTYRIRFEATRVRVDDEVHSVTVSDIREEIPRRRRGTRGRTAGLVEVRPAMPGRVVRVAVRSGDRVKRGQPLVVLEAMKMQNEIAAPGDGLVRKVGVVEGESVTPDRVVAVLALG